MRRKSALPMSASHAARLRRLLLFARFGDGEGDALELSESAGDRIEAVSFESAPELPDSGVESRPELGGPGRSASGPISAGKPESAGAGDRAPGDVCPSWPLSSRVLRPRQQSRARASGSDGARQRGRAAGRSWQGSSPGPAAPSPGTGCPQDLGSVLRGGRADRVAVRIADDGDAVGVNARPRSLVGVPQAQLRVLELTGEPFVVPKRQPRPIPGGRRLTGRSHLGDDPALRRAGGWARPGDCGPMSLEADRSRPETPRLCSR